MGSAGERGRFLLGPFFVGLPNCRDSSYYETLLENPRRSHISKVRGIPDAERSFGTRLHGSAERSMAWHAAEASPRSVDVLAPHHFPTVSMSGGRP